MPNDPQSSPSLYSQVEVSSGAPNQGAGEDGKLQVRVLEQILSALDRQNELIEELISQTNASQRNRANELNQWKQTHPDLAGKCRMAAESLSKVQINYLESITEEVSENSEVLQDGEFMLAEFVDRFGPRLAHLNGMLQVLTQLSGSPSS